MTLQETKETLLLWIHSCEKEPQVDLLIGVCSQFIERFGGKGGESVLDIELSLEVVDTLIEQLSKTNKL